MEKSTYEPKPIGTDLLQFQMETRLLRQCEPEFRVEKGYPKLLPETDTQEQPVIGSRYKKYKPKNRYLNQLSTRSDL